MAGAIGAGELQFHMGGTMNVGYGEGYPSEEGSNVVPAGLYVFDIEVIGIAPFYDEDWLRSRALRVGEHEVLILAYGDDVQSSYAVPPTGPVQAWYLLRGYSQASQVLIEVYDPDFKKSSSVSGTTKTIPEEVSPQPNDWNIVNFSVSLAKPASFYPYTFVFWAWDGNYWWYKNHRPKTAFNNWRLRKYTSAHFMGNFARLNSHCPSSGLQYWWQNCKG